MFDAHLHYALSQGPRRFEEVLRRSGIDACTLQCIPQLGTRGTEADALAFKAAHPGCVYVNGGFDRGVYARLRGDPRALGRSLATQARALLAAGCDGVKMLEGKPDIRRSFPIPDFDTEAWEPFWAFAEESGFPVTMHVNDPEEFWDAARINPYARAEGWFYGPETIGNEEQYRQMDAVLARHPRLRLQLAHLYFLSAHLPRLTALLRAYPGVCVDLTPGIELYTNLARNLPAARAFFGEFGSRILYGSDIGSRSCIAHPPGEIDFDESAARVRVIRTFLETDEDYTLIPDGKYLFRIDPTPMHGLGLSREALARVYETNARALYGAQPKPVSAAGCAALARERRRGG